MTEKTHKYPYFRFYRKWGERIQSFKYIGIRLALYQAIANYGIDRTEPIQLRGEALDFFNNEVRTNIDEQHREFDNAAN